MGGPSFFIMLGRSTVPRERATLLVVPWWNSSIPCVIGGAACP